MKRLGIFDDDVLLGENDKFRFYETSWTQSLTQEAREMDINGIELRGYRVVQACSKTDDTDRALLLLDGKGLPVYDCSSVESMSLHIRLLKTTMTEDNDIVVMAERANKAKRKAKSRGQVVRTRQQGAEQ